MNNMRKSMYTSMPAQKKLLCMPIRADKLAATMAKHTYQDVEDFFGSGYRMAKILKVNTDTVYNWKTRGGFPRARAYQIQVLSKNKFRAENLPILEDMKEDPLAN